MSETSSLSIWALSDTATLSICAASETVTRTVTTTHKGYNAGRRPCHENREGKTPVAILMFDCWFLLGTRNAYTARALPQDTVTRKHVENNHRKSVAYIIEMVASLLRGPRSPKLSYHGLTLQIIGRTKQKYKRQRCYSSSKGPAPLPPASMAIPPRPHPQPPVALPPRRWQPPALTFAATREKTPT